MLDDPWMTPGRQDKLMTWIENLGFEYMRYGNHASTMKCLQQHYDDAWGKLVDSKVLRNGDGVVRMDFWDWAPAEERKKEICDIIC